MQLQIRTTKKRQVIDVTGLVQQNIPSGFSGLATITVLHTTAAITTADLDPGTDLDLLDALEDLIQNRAWRHPHDPAHARDHFPASIVGPSVSLPVTSGHLLTGSWQSLVLIELAGPRPRDVVVTLTPSA